MRFVSTINNCQNLMTPFVLFIKCERIPRCLSVKSYVNCELCRTVWPLVLDDSAVNLRDICLLICRLFQFK